MERDDVPQPDSRRGSRHLLAHCQRSPWRRISDPLTWFAPREIRHGTDALGCDIVCDRAGRCHDNPMRHLALLGLLAAGCMNVTFEHMVKHPGQDGSPFAVACIGGSGDILLAGGAAAVHAASVESSSTFPDGFKRVYL